MNRSSTTAREGARGRTGVLRRVWDWLPEGVDRRVRVFGWLSLVWQVVLVATGGLVRLTGSGLGCPTWPRCTPGSIVNTPAMGIHGFIEFGNRMLTVVLSIVVVVTFLLVMKLYRTRRDLFWLSFWLGMSIPAQAVVGGITVLVDLNPYVVGLHFVISMALVAVSTALVVRIHTVPGPRALVVPRWFAVVAWLAAGFAGVTVLLGILTTGSGPHPGNTGTPRNGLDLELLEKLHSLPAYITGGLTLLLVGASIGIAVGVVRRYLYLLVGVELVQIAVGLLQVNIGVPGVLVDLHMILASALIAAATALVMNLTQPLRSRAESASSTVRTASDRA